MPGRHINDHQMRLFMKHRSKHPTSTAAAKAGFSTATAYRIEKDPRLPSQKKAPRGSRRPDPLEGIWEQDVIPLLEKTPSLRPVAVYRELLRKHRLWIQASAGRWSDIATWKASMALRVKSSSDRFINLGASGFRTSRIWALSA